MELVLFALVAFFLLITMVIGLGYGWIIPIVALVVYLLFKKAGNENKREQLEREREEEVLRKKREQEEHELEQKKCYTSLVEVSNKSMDTFESLAQHLEDAEKSLDQAMVELNENAYSPFWNLIEKAAKNLANYDQDVQFIKGAIANYTGLAQSYNGVTPSFPLSANAVKQLEIATGTSKKLENIVRIAQRNFEFSTIYEQRKTNQILIAGFTNLADALDRMTYQITSSIEDMAQTLNTSMRSIDARLEGVGSQLSSMNNTLTDQYHQQGEFIDTYRQATAEQASRENKVLERLDNIQRGRSPVEIGIHRAPDPGSPFYPPSYKNTQNN